MRESKKLILGGGALLLLALAVYWPALRGPFVWDDQLLVEQNLLVKGRFNFLSIWFSTDFPLSGVVLWLEWLAFGKSTLGYHVVNVLCHAAGAMLLWRVLASLRVPGAWVGAALFAVHPVCVVSVAWISELKNVLSLPFFLLSILFYLRYDERANGIVEDLLSPALSSSPGEGEAKRRGAVCYGLSLVAFVLALLSKTSTVALPVILLACVWWRRGRIGLKDVRSTAAFFVLALIFGLLTISFQHHGAMGDKPATSETLIQRLAGAGWALWFYLGKALVPIRLNLIYPAWPAPPLRSLGYGLLALWAVLLAVGWGFRKSWGRAMLFALAVFTVLLLPILGILQMYFLVIAPVSDHFQYLALAAIAALVAGVLFDRFPARVSSAAGTVLILVFGLLACQRAALFGNGEKLWRDTLARNPKAWTAHNNLGCILAERNQYIEARDHFQASLEGNPGNAAAHNNYGHTLALLGNFNQAEAEFKKALELKPNEADFHRAYADSLASSGRPQEAVAHLRIALTNSPEVATRLRLAALLRGSPNVQEVVDQYRLVLAVQPDSTEALNNLAWVLATSGDPRMRNGAEAVTLAERASRLTDRKDPMALGTLAAAYAETGRFPEAVAASEEAARAAAAAGNNQLAGASKQLSALFQRGQPYHEPQLH